MYIHIGAEQLVKSGDLVGIFDIEKTTAAKDTKDYLNGVAKRKSEVSCTDDIPRSFVVTFEKKNLDEKVYISRISASTLAKRWEDY
jgi:hypothetical protein